MKLRHWMLAFSACLMVTGAVASGCGSTETTPPATTDGGGDVSVLETSTKDVTPDVPQEVGPSCVKDADFTQFPVPDASLGDGGTNTGVCVSCVRSNCQSQANACAADCECNNAILSFFNCLGQGRALLTCLGSSQGGLSGTAQNLAIALGACVYSNCQQECGVPNLEGGTDGQSDAPVDAPDGG